MPSYEGLYTYSADAISTACPSMSIELYSEKNPNSAKIRLLDKKLVERIWTDFGAVRQTGQ